MASATAWLVRHGQSVANAGGPTGEFHAIPLTDTGQQQAQLFAERFVREFGGTPTLIVHSPYLRAEQTALPAIARFPGVPVEVWPVYEFTYLNAQESFGLSELERLPLYQRYWEADDPDRSEGDGAESFHAFLNRVRDMLDRLQAMPDGARVLVFTHGYVMQAVRLLLLFPDMTDQARMQASRNLNDLAPIQNTEILELRVAEGSIRAIAQEHITPLTLQGVVPHE